MTLEYLKYTGYKGNLTWLDYLKIYSFFQAEAWVPWIYFAMSSTDAKE